ncbi:hypothetical protein BK011_03130 [Tenericutes bacterium MZ-XQ]|jgi:hypothetical protein|nr:hypothetical protein BK011_03130 [Tenericutes bacterium MZ-XQ]
MRLSTILQVKRRKLRNRIFTLGVIATGIMSIAFAVITFYGQQSGNFVMSIDYDAYNRGIILSSDEDFTNPSPRLMTDPIEDARDMTYSWLKLDEVQNTDGNFVDPDYDYVAYTFYLRNDGLETVDITYHIRMTEIHNGLDEAIRILVIEDGVENMYQKLDKLEAGEEPPYYPSVMPKTKLFVSDSIVARENFVKFEPGQIKKFSVIMWLEGYDPDTTDEVLGGRIKLQMNFAIDGLN